MTEAPKRMFIHNSLASCIDESGHDAYPHEYVRKDVADLARPVTVAEAAEIAKEHAEYYRKCSASALTDSQRHIADFQASAIETLIRALNDKKPAPN